MPDGLLGVLGHQPLELGLGVLMLNKSRPGPAEHARKLGPGIGLRGDDSILKGIVLARGGLKLCACASAERPADRPKPNGHLSLTAVRLGGGPDAARSIRAMEGPAQGLQEAVQDRPNVQPDPRDP
jgi:hypothetical protein